MFPQPIQNRISNFDSACCQNDNQYKKDSPQFNRRKPNHAMPLKRADIRYYESGGTSACQEQKCTCPCKQLSDFPFIFCVEHTKGIAENGVVIPASLPAQNQHNNIATAPRCHKDRCLQAVFLCQHSTKIGKDI